ncbi:MFS transporter [Hansschlegelia beijingensis]|uniref:MFS transporter n=1 Tax=Hansschlegelia beijingensis TaxID=1133344 RepID=UPI00387EE896
MLLTLLRSRRFAPLFACQLFAAFNDNFIKNALAILILFQLGGSSGPMLVTLAGALFILPFFVLSALGGELADRYDKARVARATKAGEIGVALIAAIGFLIASAPLLFLALFLTGCLSALFGPVKYGILPDHLARDELVAGNALIESATFLAILAGTVGGGIMVAEASPWAIAAVTLAVSLLAYAFSTKIPPSGERAPGLRIDLNIARSTAALLRDLKRQPRLWTGAIAVSCFWLVGAVVLSLLPPLVKDPLGGRESLVTLFLVVFTVGIAIGSLAAARLSRRRIRLGLTPVGGALVGVFALDLAFATAGMTPPATSVGWSEFLRSATDLRIAVDLLGIAAGGGLFVVPVFAFLQAEAGEDHRARVIAANNVLNAAFIVGGSLILIGLQAAGLSTSTLIGLVGALSLAGAPLMWRALSGAVRHEAQAH